jgi:purine-nucleoside phosphorylase
MTGRPRPDDRFPEEGVALIHQRSGIVPRLALVLGSGLGTAIGPQALVADGEFAFKALPGFPPPSVPGHAGKLVLGTLFDVPAAVFFGRVHFYEGHGMDGPTLLPRLAAALGAHVLVVTNAAGGLDRSMRPGDLMLIRDHINHMGANPLLGWRFADGTPAFVDLREVYSPALLAEARAAAGRAGVPVREGVYIAFSGPSYETPAETAAARSWGADAVGMSTVPEAVAAAALGMRMLGISCVSNLVGEPVTHHDVLDAGVRASGSLAAILAELVPHIGKDG